MGEVTVKVNNKPYTVGCADGQEARVTELARIFDERVEMVVGDVGAIGEVRLFLMAALLMSDELQELKIERRVAVAITDAAQKVEKLIAGV